MLTNAELLQELLSIQGRVEYDGALEDLIDTVEKAVADEETAAEPMPNPFDLPEFGRGAARFDSNWEKPVPKVTPKTLRDDANRWESVPADCSIRYRNTL